MKCVHQLHEGETIKLLSVLSFWVSKNLLLLNRLVLWSAGPVGTMLLVL